MFRAEHRQVRDVLLDLLTAFEECNRGAIRAELTRCGEAIELGVPLTRQDLAELSGTILSTASRTLSR